MQPISAARRGKLRPRARADEAGKVATRVHGAAAARSRRSDSNMNRLRCSGECLRTPQHTDVPRCLRNRKRLVIASLAKSDIRVAEQRGSPSDHAGRRSPNGRCGGTASRGSVAPLGAARVTLHGPVGPQVGAGTFSRIDGSASYPANGCASVSTVRSSKSRAVSTVPSIF